MQSLILVFIAWNHAMQCKGEIFDRKYMSCSYLSWFMLGCCDSSSYMSLVKSGHSIVAILTWL